MRPLPNSGGVFRMEVMFTPAGIPSAKPHGWPSSATECARTIGPPWPMRGSKPVWCNRPTRSTVARPLPPIPPALGVLWQVRHEVPLKSGPRPRSGVKSIAKSLSPWATRGALLSAPAGPAARVTVRLSSATATPTASICTKEPRARTVLIMALSPRVWPNGGLLQVLRKLEVPRRYRPRAGTRAEPRSPSPTVASRQATRQCH
jgi:hypothetical protein